MNDRAKTTAELILRYRKLIVGFVITASCIFGYHATQLRLIDDPNRWPPASDPNVILNNEIEANYGGGNLVTIQVEVKEGDIFNAETLKIIKQINDDILVMEGVVPFYVTSLAAHKIKFMKGTEDFLDIDILMADYPQTKRERDRVEYGVYHNPTIYGPLVSLDAKATLIIADFWTSDSAPRYTTHPEIYKRIKEICEKYADNKTTISYCGTPIIIGWVNSDGLPYMVLAFGFFLLVMAVILWLAFRNLTGVILPLVIALTACIWGFGMQALILGDVLRSSSALAVPFILGAAATCHTVQFMKRFSDDEYPAANDSKLAVVTTFGALVLPMGLSLLTDLAAFLVLSIVPFENVAVLGTVTSFGLFSIMLCMVFICVPVLSYCKGKPHQERTINSDEDHNSFAEELLNSMVVILVRKGKLRWALISCLVVVFGLSLMTLPKLNIGQDNTYAIHNYLTKSWKNNDIFQMQMNIKNRFRTIFPLNILIKTKEEGGMKSPDILKRIDQFGEFLQEQESVGGVVSLPLYIKVMNRTMYGETEGSFTIPDEERPIADYLYLYDLSAPGSFQSVVDYRGYNRGVLAAYADSTSHETVNTLLKKAKEYAKTTFNNDEVTAELAGGAIGIAGAFNDNITKWLLLTTFLTALASFCVVLVLFKSLIAGIFLLLPLFMGTCIFLSVMHFAGVEINSNITTAMAIAMGVGIDAELYFVYRFKEEFARTRDFEGSLISGFVRIRKALIYSHCSLIIGCWALIPIPLYVGYLGFGMGVIILLCFIISFILPPFLYSIVKPHFLFKGIEDEAQNNNGSDQDAVKGLASAV